MVCFCLQLLIGARLFNNVRKEAINLGAIHFTFLHALIKAVTSMGHARGGSFLHTHAKKKKKTGTRIGSHTHTFDSIIIEPTSLESGSQACRGYTLFDVSLGFSVSSSAALFKGKIPGCPSRHQECNLALVNGYYRFSEDFSYTTLQGFSL